MAKQKVSGPMSLIPLVLLLVLAVTFHFLINGSGGRTYSVVPSYDLMVRDVHSGDESIRIPPPDALPEDDYTFHVSYSGMSSRGEGYLITQSGPTGWEIKCHPSDDPSSQRLELREDLLLAGVPVHLSIEDDIDDGLWVGQLLFDLDGYRYWVRCESRERIISDIQPQLEQVALSILQP